MKVRGGGIFDRYNGEFSTGIDKTDPLSAQRHFLGAADEGALLISPHKSGTKLGDLPPGGYKK
jgi:hypothetical protein